MLPSFVCVFFQRRTESSCLLQVLQEDEITERGRVNKLFSCALDRLCFDASLHFTTGLALFSACTHVFVFL